ncbi:MAG: CapA family protein [Peptostreptococcaceae bacterium]
MKKNIIISLAIILISGVGFVIKNSKPEIKKEEVVVKSEQSEVVKENITISIAGDVTLGNYHGASYYGSFDHEVDIQKNDYTHFLDGVKEVFEKDDISIVNLEGPLTTANNPKTKKFAFKGNPEYASILTEGDIEAVSISNNHSEDYLEEGIQDTVNILEEENIKYFGMQEKSIIETKGIKIGKLGYNGWPENYNEEYLNMIEDDIKNIKKECDMVLVYFHWGDENTYYPNEIQKKFAYHTIDSGADIVIGSHPHVVQGIEKYKDKYIAYSLGNFCFGGNKNPQDKDSFIYQQTLYFENNKLVNINEPNIIPVSISSSKNRNDYRPTVLEEEEKNRIIKKVENLSTEIN